MFLHLGYKTKLFSSDKIFVFLIALKSFVGLVAGAEPKHAAGFEMKGPQYSETDD